MLKISLTANAGILLEADGRKFLIDALHHEEGYPFSKVPLDLLNSMNEEKSNFHNADYLIFTHDDPDHYTPDVVAGYLQSNHIKRMILPALQYGDKQREAHLRSVMDYLGICEERTAQGPEERKVIRLERDFTLTVAGMRHMPEGSGVRPCSCMVLKTPEGTVLFTSDCDYGCSEAFGFLEKISVDLAFVNPLFFHVAAGRKLLQEVIRPEHVVIYHVPFTEDDVYSMRSLVRQSVRKYGGDFKDVRVLQEPGASITLE